jgi:hypothetical protein
VVFSYAVSRGNYCQLRRSNLKSDIVANPIVSDLFLIHLPTQTQQQRNVVQVSSVLEYSTIMQGLFVIGMEETVVVDSVKRLINATMPSHFPMVRYPPVSWPLAAFSPSFEESVPSPPILKSSFEKHARLSLHYQQSISCRSCKFLFIWP